MDNMERAEIYVSGRVQGVYFRAFTQEVALKHGLSGYVMNLADGRVFSVVEGNRDTIVFFIDELKTGPTMSNVTDMDISWSEGTGEFSGFSIRR
ncbi:acylphosphatase [Methanohalophilus levihalophilus]|uniref:acylphosphatase n=1 Tax=Methanohalophilus levihalophilus TaxID=1431282 RepID=UPI001AE21E1D|nr:acylphosphatase [Methanohalophilus levihalophilus]MBP2030945.1 acylphosphatase [Methanohalophilus levihalophilus]